MDPNSYYPTVRNLTALAYASLLAIIFVDVWQANIDSAAAKVVLWLLATAGLWLVCPGLIKQSRRSYQWLCFILLMYFIWYVQAIFAGSAGSQPGAESTAAAHEVAALVAIVVGFCAAMFAARGRV